MLNVQYLLPKRAIYSDLLYIEVSEIILLFTFPLHLTGRFDYFQRTQLWKQPCIKNITK